MLLYKFLTKKYLYTKAIAVCALLPIKSNATFISYDIKDIEKTVYNSKYSDVINCENKGSSKCATILGAAYYRGLSFQDKTLKKDKKISTYYFQKSLIDSLTSRTSLAIIIKQSRKLESHALMTSAATEGYYPAIYELAHPSSLKTDKDRLDSIKWRIIQIDSYPETASCERGFIGSIYLEMKVPDYKNALYWLNKAIIEEDDLRAQYDIAKLYAEGKGVAQDYVTAYMYYDLAGTAGAEEKSKLAERMTSEQVLEGMARSHQWQDQHHSYRPGYGAWNDMGGIDWNVH